jgi:hypothetical protein
MTGTALQAVLPDIIIVVGIGAVWTGALWLMFGIPDVRRLSLWAISFFAAGLLAIFAGAMLSHRHPPAASEQGKSPISDAPDFQTRRVPARGADAVANQK